MKATQRFVHAAFAVIAGALIALPFVSEARPSSDTREAFVAATLPTPDFIVTLEQGRSVSDLVDEIERADLPLVVADQITDDVVVLARQDGVLATTPARRVAGLTSVETVERDPVVTNFAAPPNDAQWADLWGMDESPTNQGIGVLDAWDTTKGAPSLVVAVIDSGIAKHPDLKTVLPGWDFVDDDAVTTEDDASCGASPATFHGTHVAGTIAAAAGNKVGVAGVAPAVRILPVRVNDHCGSGAGSDLISGILWAAGQEVSNAPLNPYPAKVINLSLGSAGTCPLGYQNAIDTVVAKGVIVVAATGNAASAVAAPANCDGVIAVSAGQPDGSLAGFSNKGPEATITAPGTSVLSTYRNTAGTWAPKKYGTGYSTLNGTSMATPHAAGVVALLASLDPGLTAAEATSILTSTARSYPANCTECGAGLLDAGDAVAAVTPAAGPLWPRDGATLTLGSTFEVSWASVDAAKVQVDVVQGATTLKLATGSAKGGKAKASLTAGKGIVAGAAIVRFTPSGSVAGRPVPAAFEVDVTIADPAVRFIGPAGSATYGVKSTITWTATGKTKDKGSLYLVAQDNNATLLKAGVKAQSGSFSFTPANTLPAGVYNIAFQPAQGSSLDTAYRTLTVGSVAVTATLALTEASTSGRLHVTVRPGSVGSPVKFTVLAHAGASVLKVGTVSTRAGAGAVIMKLPSKLAGHTVTFSVVPSLTAVASTTCTVGVTNGASGDCASTSVSF